MQPARDSPETAQSIYAQWFMATALGLFNFSKLAF
jgi:hypothetical protein